ncbi:o-succinylbenzoate synthase [Actinoplanes sp. NPDC051861]|uniref:o-succinylbenzoate synthase n=1 Tax=Actinoplanes sp. NPDC051861 TaxID=3155170 RepID=UPI003428F3BD
MVRLPLVTPFRTSFMTEYHRDALLVCVRTPEGVEGWGECVAMREPFFSSDYLSAAADVIQRFLVPLLETMDDVTAEAASAVFTAVKGHPMAKAALETAILDAQLRSASSPVSLATYLGATHATVRAGVSVGIMDSIPELLEAVSGYLEAGYQRIKLKIEPGWDLTPVAEVRKRFGGDVPLQVDANGAYTWAQADDLVKLDDHGLLMIEQPFAYDDLWSHVRLGRRLATTPICLDESVASPNEVLTAVEMKAARIINIKPGRVGGYLRAKQISELCAEHDVQVWVGGMLETGIGRAANLALAALPNFKLVGDLSASERFFKEDITDPVVMNHGLIKVPDGPGIGVAPYKDVLDEAAEKAPPIVIPFVRRSPDQVQSLLEAAWMGPDMPALAGEPASAHRTAVAALA